MDPLSIPLPHGTEVTTRVERSHSGRRIPQRLLAAYGQVDAGELIAEKRRGEKAELSAPLREKWAGRTAALFERLDHAERESTLPEEPPSSEALERWLIQRRLRALEDQAG
jgi:hypothetical protein